MLLDLNDAASIVRWYEVFPSRHGALLADWWQRRPEHRASIERARQLIKADPKLRLAMRQARADEADEAAWDGTYRPSHDEVFAGELGH